MYAAAQTAPARGVVNRYDDLVAIAGDVVDGGVEQLRAHTVPLGSLLPSEITVLRLITA